MTIEDTLREQLPDLSADVQGGPSLAATLRKGRSRRRTRAAVAIATAAVIACGSGVATLSAMTGTAGEDTRERTLATPPEDVLPAIEDAVREQLPPDAEITHTELTAYGDGPKPLPEKQWHQATSWHAEFRLGPQETLSIQLLHSPADAEGDPALVCRDPVNRHCSFTQGPHGVQLFDWVWALRGNRVLAPRGQGSPGNPDDGDVDPARIRFEHRSQAEPGGSYQVRVSDIVRAPNEERARERWTLNSAQLREIATSPELLDDPAPSEPDGPGSTEVKARRAR